MGDDDIKLKDSNELFVIDYGKDNIKVEVKEETTTTTIEKDNPKSRLLSKRHHSEEKKDDNDENDSVEKRSKLSADCDENKKEGLKASSSSLSLSPKKKKLKLDSSGITDKPLQNLTTTTTTTVSSSSSNNNTIYISELHQCIAEAHLQKLCQKYGTVTRIHLVFRSATSNNNNNNNYNGKNRGGSGSNYAFVTFDNSKSASEAIQNLNGRLLLKKNLIVRPAHDKSSASSSSSLSKNNNNYDNTSNSTNFNTGNNKQREKSAVERKIKELRMAIKQRQNNK